MIKTLKDIILPDGSFGCDADIDSKQILKDEAIEWIYGLRTDGVGNILPDNPNHDIIQWIKMFFNIKESELK